AVVPLSVRRRRGPPGGADEPRGIGVSGRGVVDRPRRLAGDGPARGGRRRSGARRRLLPARRGRPVPHVGRVDGAGAPRDPRAPSRRRCVLSHGRGDLRWPVTGGATADRPSWRSTGATPRRMRRSSTGRAGSSVRLVETGERT